MKIVSLLPSATEILFDLGLDEHIVGVTFECNWPPAARGKRIVSTSALPEGLSPAEIDAVVKERMAAGDDLYRLDRGAFAEIEPTIVVTQDLCAVCAVDVSEVDDALAYLGCSAQVVTLDPMTLDDVIASIGVVGMATGRQAQADALMTACRARLGRVVQQVTAAKSVPTVLLEWTDPAFTDGHWVPDMIAAAGGTSVLGMPGQRSQGRTWEAIRGAAADVVVVSPCGFGLDGAAQLAEQVVSDRLVPDGAVVWAVDADAVVVRPGPRLVEGVEMLASIFHPDIVGEPSPLLARRIA